jgi:hypothetical protein
MARIAVMKNSAGEVVARTPLPDNATTEDWEAARVRLRVQAERGRAIAQAMARVDLVIAAHFPEAVDPLKAALGVTAVGCLADNVQPTTLVLVARSGAGKSMALNFLIPEGQDDPLAKFIYRSDKLTAASFVSHRADLSPEQLKDVDLLPRIRGKTMVSKELAPFFAGKREELLERFATLASVLDGTGFIHDSGAHGRRGYDEPTNFQWLGATTPLSPEALEVMANVGPRILFYDADRPRKGVDELVEHAKRAGMAESMAACRVEVRGFLLQVYGCYPPGTVESSIVAFGDSRLRQLALWADVLTRLRAKLPTLDMSEDTKPMEQEEPAEHAERVLGMLKSVAVGSALVHGRATVDDYDLAQVGHMALSSGVDGRGRVLRVLLLGRHASAPDVEASARVSRPKALRYMKELVAVGLARFTPGKGNTTASVALVAPFTELCTAPLLKAKRGEGEGAAAERKANRGEGEAGRA